VLPYEPPRGNEGGRGRWEGISMSIPVRIFSDYI
jgi:hypothetical protein